MVGYIDIELLIPDKKLQLSKCTLMVSDSGTSYYCTLGDIKI